mgnify:CR=1 FL=1
MVVPGPWHLRVLGDGRQEKSYLYVQDCVSAMLTAASSESSMTVRRITRPTRKSS